MLTSNESSQNKILFISFNQDSWCFTIGTETGFKIYSSYPISDCFERNLNGGIGIIEMLYKRNILGLVVEGTYPKFNINKLIIWMIYKVKKKKNLIYIKYNKY